jgi:hypothetical protein
VYPLPLVMLVLVSFSKWAPVVSGDFHPDSLTEAVTEVPCSNCREKIEVICIDCCSEIDLETGNALEFLLSRTFRPRTVRWQRTLERWRFFRTTAEPEAGYFANHCAYCGAVQEDYLLHSEPGDVFFCIAEAEPGSIEFTAVEGRIWVSGDCGFGV